MGEEWLWRMRQFLASDRRLRLRLPLRENRGIGGTLLRILPSPFVKDHHGAVCTRVRLFAARAGTVGDSETVTLLPRRERRGTRTRHR